VALSLTAGCRAQSPAPSATDTVLNRRIEVTVRTEFSLPQDYDVSVGARKPSAFSGYDDLPVTVGHAGHTQGIDYLISTDNKKLARLNTFDLTKEPGSDIDVANRPIRGNPGAKVTVINFDDLECPYCARMHQEIFPGTAARYKDTVRFIYKDNPLVAIHPWAMHAAVDSNCLAAQSHEVYWTYVDYLHTHGDEITGADRDPAKSFETLDRVARQEAILGKLDETKLNACLAKQDETQVNASVKEAEDLGLTGTPELYINGERVNGAVAQESLWQAIDRALRAQGIEPPPVPAPPAPQPDKPAAAAPGGSN